MKKITILTFGLIAILGTACQNNKTTTETTPAEATTEMAPATEIAMDTTMMKSDTTTMAFTCTMHPEVKGKAGDKCPVCKMDLTAVDTHEGHAH